MIAFPIGVLLLFLPSSFATLVVFGVVYGAVNGIMTIVRGIAVPEMLTRDAYGAINGFLVAPGTAARALGPIFGAVLWAAGGPYHLLLLVTLAGSLLVALSFAIAAMIRT